MNSQLVVANENTRGKNRRRLAYDSRTSSFPPLSWSTIDPLYETHCRARLEHTFASETIGLLIDEAFDCFLVPLRSLSTER